MLDELDTLDVSTINQDTYSLKVLGMAINASNYTVDEIDDNYLEKSISKTKKAINKIKKNNDKTDK